MAVCLPWFSVNSRRFAGREGGRETKRREGPFMQKYFVLFVEHSQAVDYSNSLVTWKTVPPHSMVRAGWVTRHRGDRTSIGTPHASDHGVTMHCASCRALPAPGHAAHRSRQRRKRLDKPGLERETRPRIS